MKFCINCGKLVNPVEHLLCQNLKHICIWSKLPATKPDLCQVARLSIQTFAKHQTVCYQFCCHKLDFLYGYNSYIGFANYILLWNANFEKLAYQKLASRLF